MLRSNRNHYVVFDRFLAPWRLLLFLASANEQRRETLAQPLCDTFALFCMQMHDIELTDRHFYETFYLVNLEQNSIFATFEEQDTLTGPFICNEIDALYNITRENFHPLD